ncbi:hypothetical protein PQG02_03230 [Nostoc sp. UHCC 0926]|uniref:hypothetical protein n=1 Tax=unclassified Nostoc TaxID=2593658 RepID=UPI00235ED668|nr:hypothetical protein [Nostoc sp. UHCC 0926]WDD33420.1 hypothetical protein PQG02_03230 [Nostoc sp. UHCC 0926]
MKTYNIITLGASGAGKTVFLASLFKALAIQGEHGFFLEVEDQQKRKLLNAIYAQIITGDTWPAGTRYSEVNEWTYTCRVKTPTLDNYAACQFAYFDYAGGRLIDIDEKDTEFQNIVKKADSILGLLDGQKILACLNGKNKFQADSFLNEDLPSILRYIEKCKVPINFVISKWDLLVNNQYSLKDIRNYLVNIPQFKQIVRSRNEEGSPVRLIPVSAVGFNFATPQIDGKGMQKIPNGVPRPFQLEVPFACVLIDAVKANQKEIERIKKNLETQNVETEKSWLSGLQFSVDLLLDTVLGELLPNPATEGIKLTKIFLSKLDEILFAGYRKHEKGRLEKLRQDRDNSLRQVTNEVTSLIHAIDSFLYIQQKLDQDFPESDLFLP